MSQMDYLGRTSTTARGFTCQAWNVNSPHMVVQAYQQRIPDTTLEGHNFCRSLEYLDKACWCYTTRPDIRWEYCNVTYCPGYPWNRSLDTTIFPKPVVPESTRNKTVVSAPLCALIVIIGVFVPQLCLDVSHFLLLCKSSQWNSNKRLCCNIVVHRLLYHVSRFRSL